MALRRFWSRLCRRRYARRARRDGTAFVPPRTYGGQRVYRIAETGELATEQLITYDGSLGPDDWDDALEASATFPIRRDPS